MVIDTSRSKATRIERQALNKLNSCKDIRYEKSGMDVYTFKKVQEEVLGVP